MKMNPKNLKVGDILFNPKTKTFVQIKEITRTYDGPKSAQYFVTSGDCEYMNDSQTVITRKVMYWANELQDYFYIDPISADQKVPK